MKLLVRALWMWLALLFVMFWNGALRALVLQPRFGAGLGRQLSAVTGIGLIFGLSAVFVRFAGPVPRRGLFSVGLFWLALTLSFEFLFGRYVSGASWGALLEDYDLARGRLWPFVLLATVLAPFLCGRRRLVTPPIR